MYGSNAAVYIGVQLMRCEQSVTALVVLGKARKCPGEGHMSGDEAERSVAGLNVVAGMDVDAWTGPACNTCWLAVSCDAEVLKRQRRQPVVTICRWTLPSPASRRLAAAAT